MAIQSKNKTPKLEFKSEDEAWYDVSLQLRGSYLRIHYEEFPDDQDEMIPLEKFESREDVNSRFRFSSVQLQDQHCWKVKEGMAICASCSSDGEDNKFFDAVVEESYEDLSLLVLVHSSSTKTKECGKWHRGNFLNVGPKGEAECLAGSFTTNYRKQGKLGQMTSEGVSIEGSSIANSRDKLGETAQKANEDASTSDLHNNSLSLKDDRFKNLKEPCKQRSRAIETTRSRVDEALLSNPKEVADKSLAPEVDQTPHSGSITSQSQESQKKTEQGVNTTLKIIMGSEVLLQDLVTTDNDHKNLVQGGSDIGSETPTSSYPHKDTGLSLPEQLVRYTKMKGCEGRADACEKDSFCLGPSLSSGNMNIQEESIPESRIEADAAIILRKCDRQQNNHYVKLQEGLLTTFDPKEGNCDSLQRSNSNIEEDQPKCTSKCEGYKNISSVGHRGNGENRELLDDAIQPSNDSAGVDALGSSCLTTSHGKPNKRKKLSISSPDLCDLPDQILEKGDEIGQGVTNHKWPVKQFRSIEMQSLKVPLEAMDVSSDNENGHTVKDSGTSEKYDYNSKGMRSSGTRASSCKITIVYKGTREYEGKI